MAGDPSEISRNEAHERMEKYTDIDFLRYGCYTSLGKRSPDADEIPANETDEIVCKYIFT